jgi:hypothetical protein
MNGLEQWLKNTIPGLILLGAIGSLLSVFIIRLFKPWLQRLYKKILYAHWNLHVKQAAKQNWILGGLSVENNLSKAAVYILYHTFTFTALIIIATASILILVYRLGLTSSPYLSAWNLFLVIVFMISTYRLLLKIWIFHITYSTHITPILGGKSSTKAAAEKEVAEVAKDET